MVQSHLLPIKIMHSWLLSSTNAAVIILLLQYSLHTTGVGAANFTIMNNCSESILVVFADASTMTREGDLGVGRSLSLVRPNGWAGRVWGLNAPSGGVTLAEFRLASSASSPDFYDVSLVQGYNLPMAVSPIGSGSRCNSTGCIAEINQICPPEVRTDGFAGCRGPCKAVGTAEHCCMGGVCGTTNYTRLFKEACPIAYSGPSDDGTTSIFSCTAASHYFIAFCPSSYSFLNQRMRRPAAPALAPDAAPAYPPQTNPNNNPPQTNPNNNTPQTNSNNPSPQRKSAGKKKNRAKDIITMVSASVSGVVIIAVAIAICCCCYLKRRQSSQNTKSNRDVENLLLQQGALAPKRYKYSEIKKMTRSFSDKLGEGGFGSVYKGTLPDSRLVAVKILSEILDSNAGEEFINEVASIGRTFHVNIVTLLGFCYEGNKSALVYEFMPNKSLDKFLGDNGDPVLDMNKLYEIAVGIARGLEYLHTGCTTRIVHFDIKPQNILLDEDFCPKIADFGLAKLCKKKQSVLSMLGMRGTVGYIAPEVFSRNYGGVSHKSDVYSYGMMLLDMARAKKDGGTVVTQSSENNFPDEVYEQVIIDVTNSLDDEWMMIEEEEEKRRKMMLIGFWCIQTVPSERPSISKVVEMLEGNLDSIQIPPKPFLFSTVIPNQETSSSSSSANVETENIAGAWRFNIIVGI